MVDNGKDLIAAAERSRDKGARFLLIVASLVIVVAGMKAAGSLILPFLVSIFLAMISLPLLNWLQNRRVPKILAVLVTLFAVLGVLTAVGIFVGGSINAFTQEAPKYRERLEGLWTPALQWARSFGLQVPGELTTEVIDPGIVMDLLTGTLRSLAAILSNLLLVVLTMLFILVEAAGFPEKLQAAFGRRGASARLAAIRREVSHYLGIKTLVSLVTGSLVAASMAVIGVDFPLLWGTLAFMLNYIPNLGSILAALPPVLLAWIQLGLGRALAVALVFVAINVLLGNLLEPYLMGRRLGLSTLVIFLSLVFWGWIWGPVGMLLSVPLTMIVKIMLENTEDLKWVAVLLDASPGK
jgi:predicted PurR-regulated permease PerM